MELPAEYQTIIDSICKRLPALLGENLYSCILYGSAVRGNVVPNVSDINILIVLNESTPDAHLAITDCIEGDVEIDPFIITRKGMERSFKVFAIKFRSIKRNYKVARIQLPSFQFQKKLSDFYVNRQSAIYVCAVYIITYVTGGSRSAF